MSNMGGPINFLTHSNGYIFFFAGATAPPRDNVAPPLEGAMPTSMYINTQKKKKKLQITFGSKVDNKKNLHANPWNPKIR